MSFTPHPDALKRKDQEKGERDERLALDVLKLAVDRNKETGRSAGQIADEAETYWQWVTSDTWPPPKSNQPKSEN